MGWRNGVPPSLAEHSKAPRLRHGDLCLDRLDDKSAQEQSGDAIVAIFDGRKA